MEIMENNVADSLLEFLKKNGVADKSNMAF